MSSTQQSQEYATTAIAEALKRWEKNPMLKPRLSKVTVNVALGSSGERLIKVAKMLEELTGQKPSFRKAKKTIREFGIKKGENIAVAVTLRGEKAKEFLRKALDAVGYRLKLSSFDEHGNISFGIREYIGIPGARYDPEVGMFGMDVCVTLDRPGYRVMYRKRKRSGVPRRHRVSRWDAVAFMIKEFGVKVV